MGATDPKKAAPGTIRADLADQHRAERRARFRQPRERRARDRATSSPRRSSARAEREPPARSTRSSSSMSEVTTAQDQPARPHPGRDWRRSSSAMGEKPFRARQLMKWIYQRAVGDFEQMTDLGKDFRGRLAGDRRDPHAGDRSLSQVVGGRHAQVAARASRAARPSRWSSSRSRAAARCASRARSAARWTAASARPAQQGFNRNLDDRRDRRPGLARQSRARLFAGRRPRDHQRRVHGHGRAADELPQRRARGRGHDGRPRPRPLAPPRDAQHLRASCRR